MSDQKQLSIPTKADHNTSTEFPRLENLVNDFLWRIPRLENSQWQGLLSTHGDIEA